MKVLSLLGAVLVLASPLLAHTGEDFDLLTEPSTEIVFSALAAQDSIHNEDPNGDWFKGWWWVTLTNNTGIDWTGVNIKSGVGDLVAIVKGNGLEDEFGFVSNSVMSSKAGSTYSYVDYLGDRTYENLAYGELYKEANIEFGSVVAGNGGKVAVRVYTDNSYYEGPYATSFSLTITPIPEPMSILLLGIGGLFLARRRR